MFDYTKTVVGLDVHKESIVAAVLPPDSDTVALTTKFENTPTDRARVGEHGGVAAGT